MNLLLIFGLISRSGGQIEEVTNMRETMVETEVTYTLEYNGKFFLVEHVPARVCRETGEQYFSPEIVEHIQAIIKGGKKPDKMVEIPVYRYG